VHQGATAPATRRVAAGQHADDFVEALAREGAIRIRPPQAREQRCLLPVFGRGLGDDLLRQHVERFLEGDETVELPVAHRAQQRRALRQIVAGGWEETAFRQAGDRVPGSPDTLKERRDPVRGSQLTHQIHVADVDAELERGGGHERLEAAGLQPLLRVEAPLLGEASVMRGDRVRSEAPGEMMRHPLGQPARVGEDERGPVRLDEGGETIVVLLPDLVRHHRLERRVGQLDADVHGPAMAFVDQRAVGSPGGIEVRGAHEVARDVLERLLRRREPQPEHGPRRNVAQPLERERQMRATTRTDERVNLVDDDRAHRPQDLAASFRGQQQVERLRRRHQDVRRRAHHRGALGLRRVAAAHGGRDTRRVEPHRPCAVSDAVSRGGEIPVNVGRERLQRRHVDDAHLVGQGMLEALGEEGVDGGEKPRERLAGPGRRRDERVAPRADRLPAAQLCRGRRADRLGKPARHGRMKGVERHGIG
jgi:hypothetical protein